MNSLNYLNSRYREDRTAITSDRSANFNTSALNQAIPLFPPALLSVYVPPRSPVAGLRDAEPTYRHGGGHSALRVGGEGVDCFGPRACARVQQRGCI